MKKRILEELINTQEPAWPMVQQWIREAKNHVELLPVNKPNAEAALLETQVTTRSPMGAIIYESGGILVDYGWLRILGSGHKKLPRSLPEWNKMATGKDICELPFILVADDVLGGFYALDGGGLGDPGKVFYLPPDILKWENMELGYTDFFADFCLNSNLDDFYEPYRWADWKKEVANIAGDKAYSIYPFLWAEGGPIEGRHRSAVPVNEAYVFAIESAKQLANIPEGSQVQIFFKD